MDATVAARDGKRESFIVQAMAEPGSELLVGVVEDPITGYRGAPLVDMGKLEELLMARQRDGRRAP